jgi:outer membrane lipoprotein-sorting protein
MRRDSFAYIGLVLCITAVLGLVARQPAVYAQEPSGSELVTQMQAAVDALQSVHVTTAFQVASLDGAVTGTIEFWGQRPSLQHASFKSPLGSLDGLELVNDGKYYWAYSPRQQLVVVSEKSNLQLQLGGQPELRDLVDYSQRIVARGFADSQATNLGSEQVNGRDTYKVAVTYAPSTESSVNLEGVTTTFWVDQVTSLPQRVEVNVQREGVTFSGYIVVQGEIQADQAIDPARFAFLPPAGATVLNLAKLPPLPSLAKLIPKG